MEDTLINFETAKLAKEKKFNTIINYYYDSFGDICSSNIKVNWNDSKELLTSAPTQSLLQKWLREVHNLHITIYSQSQESWMFRVTKQGQSLVDGLYGEDYENYEEALEDGLQEALKLIK